MRRNQVNKNKIKKVRNGTKQYLWDGPPPGYNQTYGQNFPNVRIFLAKSKEPTPGVIICPGGGYEKLADHEGEPVAKWLNKIGISAFVLQYRIAPYKHPLPYADLRRAICHVKFNAPRYNLLEDAIGVMGFSAGAHLAACAGILFDDGLEDDIDPEERMNNRPDFMILAYPVVSFTHFAHVGSMNNLIGPNATERDKVALSIEQNIRKDTPPAFVFHLEQDPTVDVRNSQLLVQAMRKQGISVEAHYFANKQAHGVGLADDNPKVGLWRCLCEHWIKEIVDAKKLQNQ